MQNLYNEQEALAAILERLSTKRSFILSVVGDNIYNANSKFLLTGKIIDNATLEELDLFTAGNSPPISMNVGAEELAGIFNDYSIIPDSQVSVIGGNPFIHCGFFEDEDTTPVASSNPLPLFAYNSGTWFIEFLTPSLISGDVSIELSIIENSSNYIRGAAGMRLQPSYYAATNQFTTVNDVFGFTKESGLKTGTRLITSYVPNIGLVPVQYDNRDLTILRSTNEPTVQAQPV